HVRTFEHPGAVRIAHQQVGRDRRVRVHRTGGRHAHVVIAEPARVLHRRVQTTGSHAQLAHRYSTSSSSRLTASGSASSAAGSNSTSRMRYRNVPASTSARVASNSAMSIARYLSTSLALGK